MVLMVLMVFMVFMVLVVLVILMVLVVLVVLVIPTPHAAEESATARRARAVARLHWRMLFDYCTATETFVV
jgi:hypothetical protein